MSDYHARLADYAIQRLRDIHTILSTPPHHNTMAMVRRLTSEDTLADLTTRALQHTDYWKDQRYQDMHYTTHGHPDPTTCPKCPQEDTMPKTCQLPGHSPECALAPHDHHTIGCSADCPTCLAPTVELRHTQEWEHVDPEEVPLSLTLVRIVRGHPTQHSTTSLLTRGQAQVLRDQLTAWLRDNPQED